MPEYESYNRAVYTRENKPGLTIAVQMVQNLCSRLIQPMASSSRGRLILAEGFWDGLIQAAAYLGRESVRINALKRCPRLAEAVNDCCACSVFNYIPDLHGRETRVAVAGKWVLFAFTKWKMADRDSCKKRNVWSAPEEKQVLLICSELEIAETSRWNHSTDRCRIFHGGFGISFPIFFDQLITWEPNTNLDRRDSLKWKRQWKKQRFLRAKASRLAFLLARAIVARCKRNYPKTRYQNKLRHHWTDLAAN